MPKLKKLIVALALLLLVSGFYAAYVLLTLPDVQILKRVNPTTTAMMQQRADEKGGKAAKLRLWTPYSQISPDLRNAVLAAEDSAFFQHSGFDFKQIKESIKRNWAERRLVRGASTITQQLAKNLYLSTSRNPLRKVKEVFIARELERILSKQRIFEIYLNAIEWGDGIYGIGQAAEHYFGKSPSALLPEEAAILAAMIPNPRRYSPSRNLAYLEKRKGEILARMSQYKYLATQDYEDARFRPVSFRRPSESAEEAQPPATFQPQQEPSSYPSPSEAEIPQ